jgi:cytochrome c oxidase assembly protein subunit 15
VAQIGIVVTGGAVRLTGSGLGCSTWPQCEPGQFTPVMHDATSWHPFIEFGNRTLTGVLGVLALAVVWVAFRDRRRSPGYRRLALVPLAGTAVQAVVGGLTVLVDLHPGWVGGHFLVSMVLVAASYALVVRHREGDGPPAPVAGPRVRALTPVLWSLLTVVLALGVVVTGAGPHSGDAEHAQRWALDPVVVARVHALSVWLYVAVVVLALVLVRGTRTSARSATLVLLAVTLAQGLVGYVQYLTDLPAVLVATHMLGAALLVVAQVRQTMSLRTRLPAG